MSKRPWEPAPPHSGIKAGGIRDRALRALWARGPQREDPAKTKASQAFWAKFREGQELLAHAEQKGARLGRPPTVEIVVKRTPVSMPNLAVVTTKVTDNPYRLKPFATFVLDDSTGEITNLSHFASVAAALLRHDELARKLQAKESA